MSNETKNNKSQKGALASQSKKIKMAYTLNNWQPVLCTLVSDQPFFYMDEEYDFDDDAVLDDEFLNAPNFLSDDTILAEIESMKKKMESYETVSKNHQHEEEQRLNEFILDCQTLSNTDNGDDVSLNDIVSFVQESRMGNLLLEHAKSKNIEIRLSQQIETAFYDEGVSKIFIRPDLNKTDQVLLLVQELRRCWQASNKANKNPLTLHPDHAILINRAQKADLAVAIVRCAWELKLKGFNDVWTRVENSSMSDLGQALAREALADFRSLNNGKASSAVFETWFLSERSRHEDKILIQGMLADYRGYVYGDTEASFITANKIICGLGEQPFGKNYLASYAHMILNDTLFTEVRDRSNANFLWFIKFERTFKETEQELQSSGLIKMAGVDQPNNKDKFEDNQNANTSTPCGGSTPLPPEENSEGNVIFIPFGQMGQTAEGV